MKILGVGLNYPQHIQESPQLLGLGRSTETSVEPIIFHKGDSVLRPGMPFFLPDLGSRIDYEAEIVVQICRVGKHIAPRFAHRYYQYLSIGIDFTARDLQRRAIERGEPWTLSKAFDNSAVVGDWVDKVELGYPERGVEFSLQVDGEVRQRGNTNQMIHTIDQLIAYTSQFYTLKMGDLIFTGTPSGSAPIKIGNRLEGFIGSRRLFCVDIK